MTAKMVLAVFDINREKFFIEKNQFYNGSIIKQTLLNLVY